MRIPLGTSDFSRALAETPNVRLLNRYFEKSPQNQKDQVALLTRPGLRKWKTIGDGPIRATYSQPGTFDEALFVVSGADVYRIDQDETETLIGTLGSTTGFVSMAATDTYLFIADGLALHYYTSNNFASGTLTSTGAIANGDKVVVGSTTYQFTSGSVDAGAPAGTSGAPWLVALGASVGQALQHLFDAIGNSGLAGTDYSSALIGNAQATPMTVDATTLTVRASLNGTAGNTIATTETGANIAWGAATLASGGSTSFSTVTTPDGDGIVSVGVIASFTICVVAQGQGKNGRFYWIEPGEVIIDPLNFATAERSPDPVHQVVVVGDQFWLPGTSTNEVWYPTGDALGSVPAPAGPLVRQGHLGRHDCPGQGRRDGGRHRWHGLSHGCRADRGFHSRHCPAASQRLREAINAQRVPGRIDDDQQCRTTVWQTPTTGTLSVYMSKWQPAATSGSFSHTNYRIVLGNGADDTLFQASAATDYDGLIRIRGNTTNTFYTVDADYNVDDDNDFTNTLTVFMFANDFSYYDRLDITTDGSLYGAVYFRDINGVHYLIGGNESNVQAYQILETGEDGEGDGGLQDDDVRLRVWTYSLDGHDYFVLRVGTSETLVYDLTTDTWASWASPSRDNWRAHVGVNWVGMSATTMDRGYGSDVVAGDDVSGVLWVLDPTYGRDDRITTGSDAFNRIVTGGVQLTGRDVAPCGAVTVDLSVGAPSQTGATIMLETSDDFGHVWANHGAITVAAADYSPTVEWRILGTIKAPGRVFRLTDNGATVRIAGLDLR
jgi:hypothetical protein